MFDQTVGSKTKGWKYNKFVQNKNLYRYPLKSRTLTELILKPQSFQEWHVLVEKDAFKWHRRNHLVSKYGRGEGTF